MELKLNGTILNSVPLTTLIIQWVCNDFFFAVYSLEFEQAALAALQDK
jgi:hypothetical protein